MCQASAAGPRSAQATPAAVTLGGAPPGRGQGDRGPSARRLEAPARDRDDPDVDERQRDVGAGPTVEREDHARRRDEEADAETSGEGREPRRARVDGRALRPGRLARGPAPEPAEPPQAAEET